MNHHCPYPPYHHPNPIQLKLPLKPPLILGPTSHMRLRHSHTPIFPLLAPLVLTVNIKPLNATTQPK